jgi:hypothetical protein
MADPDFIEFEPTLVTVPESTLERALIALEAGWESASDEHAEAIALNNWTKSMDQYYQRQQTREELLAIAAELEANAQ